MRVVCPYVDLRPETYRAVSAWPQHEFVYVGGDEYEYGRLLRELWRAGESFCLIEHDVVPHADTLQRFADCEHWYCAAPYEWTTDIGVTLGCTKFDAGILAAYPDAMEIAIRIPSNYGDPGHHKQIGIWLQAAVLRDLYGEQPCCHEPPVRHLNESQRLLDIYEGKAVATRVLGRVHLPPGTVERIAAEVLAEG